MLAILLLIMIFINKENCEFSVEGGLPESAVVVSFSGTPSSFTLKNLSGWTRHPLVGHLVLPAAREGRSGNGPEKAAEIEPSPRSFLTFNILVFLPKLHTLKMNPLSFYYRLGDEAQVQLRK